MRMLDKILMAIDINDIDNESLIRTGASLAGVFNSRITLLNVIPNNYEDLEVHDYLLKTSSETITAIREKLEQKGVKRIRTMTLEGSAFDQIIQVAETEEVNLILMGTGFDEENDTYPLGITTEKVIRKTTVPVWAVKPESDPEIKNISCPVDFSEASRRALSNAIMLARKLQAKLTVFTVFEPIEVTSRWIRTNLNEQNEEGLKRYTLQFTKFLSDFGFDGISWESRVLQGVPDVVILNQIRNTRADLLLMGTTGRTGLSRILMGSVTEKVIREVPASFITTKSRNILNNLFESQIESIEKLMAQANKYFASGDYEKSVYSWEQCLLIYQFFIPAWFGAANAYKKMGDTEKAEQYFDTARELLERLWEEDMLKQALKITGK